MCTLSQPRLHSFSAADDTWKSLLTKSKLRNKILEIEARLMDRYGALVATVLQSDEEWEQAQGLPLACNIACEEMAL